MGLPCKTKIEKAWLITSLITLFLHRMLEASFPAYDSPDTMVRLWLEVAMVVLSFPLGGFTMFVISDATLWCDGCGNLEWLLDWSTLLLAGYLQWFWLLPEILRDRNLTFLNLRQPVEAALPDASSAPTQKVLPVAAAGTASESFTRPLVEFDEAGLTALDRVLQTQSAQRVPSPRPPAPRAELIFPEAQ